MKSDTTLPKALRVGASLSDGLMLYPGYSFGGGGLTPLRMQSEYSKALANRAVFC